MFGLFLRVFGTIFLAEIGDKTQLATFLYAGERPGAAWVVFFGAAAALVASSAFAVLLGAQIQEYVPERWLRLAAGTGFILVGVWTLWRG